MFSFPIRLVITAFFDAIAYRIRGGGWISFGSDTPPRFIWGIILSLTYLLSHGHGSNIYYEAGLVLLGFFAVLIPHDYCANIGRWATPQGGWPSFFIPTPTQAEWTGSSFLRVAHDLVCMACSSFISALIVFIPSWLCYGVLNEISSIGIVTIGVPIAYFVGWYIPVTITSSLKKNSTDWCEFLTGSVWALAMAVL